MARAGEDGPGFSFAECFHEGNVWCIMQALFAYNFKEVAMAWSEEKKNETREKIGPGAMVKDGRGQYGFFCASDAGIKILGVQPSGFLAVPSDEIVATFADVEEMIAAGWVID